jgi:hypothetical protein
MISPWRSTIPFLSTNLNPLYPRMIEPNLLKIDPVVLEKKWKM